MSNLRFGLINLLDADQFAPTIKNGGGGGAPSRDETAGYVMEQATYRDRLTLWRTSASPAGTVYADFDLGDDKSIAVAALLGLVFDDTAPATCVVSSATAAVGYPPTSGGAWTVRGTVTMGDDDARDHGVAFAAATARYWRFEFTTCTDRFGVGRLWLGALTDTGYVYGGQGSSETPITYGVSDAMPGGDVVSASLGYEGRSWVMTFTAMSATVRDYFWAVLRRKEPVLMVDGSDSFFEVWVPDRAVPTSREFVGLYGPSITLARLP